MRDYFTAPLRQPRGQPTKSIAERFWEKVNKTETCWLWTGAQYRNGYGEVFIGAGTRGPNGRMRTQLDGAHRVSWEIHFGPIPVGLFVCHTCDVKRCVRPEHLFLGTQADNIRDAISKDRLVRGERHWSRIHPERVPRGDLSPSRRHPETRARGESHGRAKLTAAQVREILAAASDGTSLHSLAGRYRVDPETVRLIVRRKTWLHLAQ